MKKTVSLVTASLLAVLGLSSVCYAENRYTLEAYSVFAKPIISVTLPKSMSFVFNPYGIKINEKGIIDRNGTDFKVIPNYIEADENGWTVKNTSDVSIRMGVYVQCENVLTSDFSVRDANINTVDSSDETKKYLLLDIKASGGSSGTQNVVLLDEGMRTDEGNSSKAVDLKAGWWSDENEDTITVIHDIPKDGTANVTMTGTTLNAGDLPWTKSDKATIYFVFSFDAEPTTGS